MIAVMQNWHSSFEPVLKIEAAPVNCEILQKKWIIYFKINMVILSMKSNRLFYDKGKCAKIMYDLRAPITNLDRINSSKESSWHKLILKALRMKLQNPLPFLKYSPSTYNSNYGTCPKFDS